MSVLRSLGCRLISAGLRADGGTNSSGDYGNIVSPMKKNLTAGNMMYDAAAIVKAEGLKANLESF